jgi:hypothetical protein
VILRDRLLAALARINPHIPAVALEQAAHFCKRSANRRPWCATAAFTGCCCLAWLWSLRQGTKRKPIWCT